MSNTPYFDEYQARRESQMNPHSRFTYHTGPSTTVSQVTMNSSLGSYFTVNDVPNDLSRYTLHDYTSYNDSVVDFKYYPEYRILNDYDEFVYEGRVIRFVKDTHLECKTSENSEWQRV